MCVCNKLKIHKDIHRERDPDAGKDWGQEEKGVKKPGVLLFSRLVMSDSLQPHGLWHSRLPCPSLSPGVCSDSRPLSHDVTQPSHSLQPPSAPELNLSQHQGLFQWASSLHQVAKVFNFGFSPSKEYSGLISFTFDWFDLLAAQGTLKSLFQLKSINSSVPSFSYNSIITDLSVLPWAMCWNYP